ncbi:MAG: hypothetical protein QOJ82_567 [Solirubrobacteraceae bacterium]|jgi:hypothetical protein|nr:hypothetical protein [Solirubrobacteraceae bacterium]
MSRLDALPADQKAVLALLLRQGKGYDDLSELLRLDAAAVRSRAHDAVDALGPGAAGLPAERRHALADWLLGQQPPEDAEATRAFAETSSAARAWARAVARELEPLAGDRLPEIPADRAGDEPAPAEPEPTAATPFAPAPTAARPRVSRRGGAILIGGVLAVAVAVVLVLTLTGGGGKGTAASTAADTTTTTRAQPQVKAQASLVPPKGAPAKGAVGIAQIVDVGGQQTVNAVAQGLPATKKAAYGIWLYAGPSNAKLIGGFDKTDNNGHLLFQAAVPGDLSAYREMLVTRETSGQPKRPGPIYLRGTIGAPPPQQQPSGGG